MALRLVAVAALLVALWAEYGSFGRLEALLGLLIGIYLLKLLETRTRRDARVVIGIGFVALTASFLHDQGIVTALGAVLVASWLVQSLVALTGGPHSSANRIAWRETAWLMGLSAPLMVAVFIAMPRFEPLWSLPTLERASTGLSDSMAPGDFARLSRSDDRAFRASFEGAVPPPAKRYWRVYTLSHFDGERWSRETPESLAATLERPVRDFARSARRNPFVSASMMSDLVSQKATADASEGRPAPYRTELLLEPDSRPWRPSLGTPLASPERQRFLGDGTVEGLTSLSSRGLVTLKSSGEAPSFADPAGRAWHTLLPQGRNPRTLALAKALWRDAEGDPQAYLAAVMARFAQAPYRYTLEPPRLTGEHRVDAFLFDSRAGYCAHYASATAMLARAVGIPARVVAGFQGGERHPDGHLTVRDYDAHAWVEVWREGSWRRLDPTAVIAPERIEQGPAALSDGSEAFLADARLSALRFRDVAWLNSARLAWERLEYRWQRQVVGYERGHREALMAQLKQALEAFINAVSDLKEGVLAMISAGAAGALVIAGWGLAVALAGLAIVALLGIGLRTAIRRLRGPATLHQILLADAAWLERHGHPARPAESPAAHLRRLAMQSLSGDIGATGVGAEDLQGRRDFAAACEALAEAIEQLYYAPLDGDERDRWRTRFEVRRHEWRRLFLSIRRCRSGSAGRLARWRQTWHLGD
ncbi:transglutaminaseTgpA domain-containing protein [Halomonas salinarum]|uniref:transglutaminase family protein n=1 Tax=Halomonas salinarum TaxID=1158993 RepID=UPI0014399D80|nr:transglutaminaseTgpA domain-containing protein [Halomonas salinarum]